jgi:uncharacterized MAPEG superfamily protein
MILLILLVILAIATGVAGALVKGAFWLFILTALLLVGAYLTGRARSR